MRSIFSSKSFESIENFVKKENHEVEYLFDEHHGPVFQHLINMIKCSQSFIYIVRLYNAT